MVKGDSFLRQAPVPAKARKSILTHLMKLAYVAGLLALQQGAYLLSFEVFYPNNALPSSYQAYITSIPVMVIISLVVIDFIGMTHFYRKSSVDMLSACFKLTALVTLSVTFFAFFFQYFAYPRYVIALGAVLMFFALTLWSILFLRLSQLIYPHGRMLIVARDEADARALFEKARSESRRLRITYLGWAEPAASETLQSKIRAATEVLVSMNISDEAKAQIMLVCAEQKKTIYMVPQFYELAYARFRIVQFYDTPTFMVENNGLTFQQRLFKRAFDILFSLLTILLTLPLQLLVALAIRLDSPGPVIYTQERNTLSSRIYDVLKFRTMVHNAEERFGAYQASQDDPRLTRVGRFLRSTHLDELPQFYNVLKGDMSVVGPRSDRPITIGAFEERIPGYRQRLKVKSGITGLAQVMGKYNTDPEDKLRYDMIYIKNYSLLLDFKIIFMTFGALLPKNQYSIHKSASDYVVSPGERPAADSEPAPKSGDLE